MARILYRIGRWCAEHAKSVVALWLALLVLVGGAAASFGTPMTSKFSLPDSEFQSVLDKLGAEIPEFRGGFGTVVFESETGAFTASQKTAIEKTIASWKNVDHVTAVTDPFAAQQQLDESRTELDAAEKKLTDGQKDLETGRAKLDKAGAQVAQGEGLIKLVARKDPNDPSLPALRKQVADGKAQLAEGEKEWEAGKADLEAGWQRYNVGKAQIDSLGGMHFVTSDGRYALTQIQFDDDVNSVPYEARSQIPERAGDLAAAGVKANYSSEIVQEISLVGPGEIIGLTIALIVLVAMLGTLIAAGLPLVGAIMGVGVGLAGAVAASHFFDMHQMTPTLALMLGLAVGIDYALFIVNRHRSMYLHGTPLRESIGRAVGTSGSAVTFAGMTVVIALAALVLSGIPILAQMGLVAAGTVAVAVLVAVTLTPALLSLIGTRVASRRLWRANGYSTPADDSTRVIPGDEHEEEHGGWYVRLTTGHPWLTILAVVSAVVVLALPALSIRLGLPDGSSEPKGSSAYTTYHIIDEHFGKGMNGPVLAVATMDSAQPTAQQAQDAAAELAIALADSAGVDGAAVAGVSDDHKTIALQVIPQSGPADEATLDTVHNLQDSAAHLGEITGTTVGFTGQTVANIEISEKLSAALPGYLLTVVGLSLVILLMVFRSLVVPLVATAGFLLSVAAAFGVTVAVYQWGWLSDLFGVSTPGPILSFMPIILIGVLFGLAMDYQMFLVTGMREAWAHGEDAQRAVKSGFLHGAKVVTAAAIIMASVFGGFVFSHLAMIRPIGLGLAVGVIVDAWLVRMTLTPAIMQLLGERAWTLPRWLDRLIPNVDVEGASLEGHTGPTPGRPTATQPAGA